MMMMMTVMGKGGRWGCGGRKTLKPKDTEKEKSSQTQSKPALCILFFPLAYFGCGSR